MDERTPAEGEIWWVELDPVVGREQGGRRPALVISTDDYNAYGTRRVIVVPITTRERLLPTWIWLSDATGLEQRSWALVDQVRSIDVSRFKRHIGNVGPETLSRVRTRLGIFLGL